MTKITELFPYNKMTRKQLALLVPAAVILAAAVGSTVAMVGPNHVDSNQYACTSTTVDLRSPPDFMSNSVELVVLVNGSSSASISQQVVQSNDRTEVDIDVEYDDGSVAISGETVENGSLVLSVTRDGTVVNESVVVNGSTEQVVFHLDKNGDVHISRKENSSDCLCNADSAESEVNVDADGIEVDIGDADDTDADHETDGGRNVDCSESVACTCSDSSAKISPPVRRSADSTGTGVSVGRVIVRPNLLVGLAMPGLTADCAGTATGAIIDCPPGHEDSSG